MAGYVMRQFTCPKAVTHPSTNRARCRAATLIETNALPLHQTAIRAHSVACAFRGETSYDDPFMERGIWTSKTESSTISIQRIQYSTVLSEILIFSKFSRLSIKFSVFVDLPLPNQSISLSFPVFRDLCTGTLLTILVLYRSE